MKRYFVSRRVMWVSAVAVAAVCLAIAILPVWANDSAQRAAWKVQYHRPAEIPFPDDNPYTKAKDDLGRLLFFDPILSGSGARSCASCHNPGLGWSDGLAKAHGDGEKPLALHTPTVLNMAWGMVLGWDGKFDNLEAVAFEGPITASGNMNRKEEDLIAALSGIAGYRKAFAQAFQSDGTPTRPHIESALATFERTIVSGPAPFDRWIEGDERAIDESAKRGFDLFNGKAACAECHSGWNFTDGSFHDIGTASGDDIGRARLFPTSVKLRYAFKVPTLRDVARRGPYMHDGSEPTLEAVIDLYDRGGIDRPSRSELMKPLGLSAQEKADLIAFLGTLTGEPKPFETPVLPR
jgi:cytochrome c peroxidase